MVISIKTLEKHRPLLQQIAHIHFEKMPPKHTEVTAIPRVEWFNLSETITGNVTIRLRILEDMPSIHAIREYYPRYVVLHDNQVIGDRFYDAKEGYYLAPVQQWLDTVESMERVHANTATIKEEIVAAAWRPERVARLLEAGIDPEDL